MLIEIITIILLLIMVIMQFFVNNITRYVAIFIGILLFILQVQSAYENNKDKKTTNEKLNNIQTSLEYSIDWQNMEAKLEYLEPNIDKEIANRLVLPIKIYSLDNIKLPKNSNLNLEKIISDTYENDVFKYKELKSKDVEELFNLFSNEEKNIYQDVEEKANVGHLYLKPKEVKDNYINFSIEYSGLEPLGNYNTLQKLNNTILITRIPTFGNLKDINIIKDLQLNINTNKGVKRLYFSSRPIENGSIKALDYIGIYIPKDFFK